MDNPAGFIISMMEMNACRENDNPMPGGLSDLRLCERTLATGSLSAAAREALPAADRRAARLRPPPSAAADRNIP
ncbi:hypothetical protein [Azotobacter chroococcum]|uniref:hypothetical protein n=1 Tax=Azotobacter chroococcum TaxID=353 RepID=UPI0010AEB0B6|nr:hypothetical protein [Azotobacter chroococcum]TKD35627.1 hypothetical protein FCG41_17545 [Azotobacter chroococcum]